ncbi:MAG: LytTR family transcriptional regulator [Saprospiraceae bacterium]|nr:LytTR family transcriptional regulator [Saprospiraceae bacterium]
MTLQNKFTNLRLVIIKEDTAFLKLLLILLNDIGVTEIDIIDPGKNTLPIFDNIQADVLFIDADVTFDQKKGTEIGYWLRQHSINLPLVFMTSHLKQYNPEEFQELQPISFMSKELSLIKLLQTLELVSLQRENILLHQLINDRQTSHTQLPIKPNTPAVHQAPEADAQFFFKVGDSYKAISISDIAYFYADQKMSYAKMGNRSYPTNVQLKILEEELKPWGFLRAHKSYLLNTRHIDSFHPSEGAVFINNETLPIGYAYRKMFLTSLKLLK